MTGHAGASAAAHDPTVHIVEYDFEDDAERTLIHAQEQVIGFRAQLADARAAVDAVDHKIAKCEAALAAAHDAKAEHASDVAPLEAAVAASEAFLATVENEAQ